MAKKSKANAPTGPQIIDVPFAAVLAQLGMTALDRPVEVTLDFHSDGKRIVVPRLVVECPCGGLWATITGAPAMALCGNCGASYGIAIDGRDRTNVKARVTAMPSEAVMAKQQSKLLLPNAPRRLV